MKKSIFLFFAAILCATSAWAGKGTIYVTPANMWGSSWDYSNSSLKIAYNYNSSSGDQWTGEKAMTKTTYTFHNFPVYSYEISSSTNWAKIFVYHYKNNTKKDTYNVGGDNWIEFTKYAKKLYNGWRNNAHEWLEQSEFDKNTQVTVYYALDNTSEHTIKANMRISNDYDVWKTYTMNSTGKTYNGKTIYSCTFTDYREYLYVLQFQQYDGSNWKSQVVPIDNKWTAKSTYENKLYTGSEWIDYTYDVTATFNANGHGTAPNSQTVLNGNKITEPTAPSEDGYTFGGWYKEAECTNKWNFETDVLNDNITLYAKWSEITHTVTFANDGNGTTNKTGAIEVGVITGIAIDATPNTDYEFNVWESSNGGTFATTAADASNIFYPTANTTLTATFRSTAVNALLVVAGENITSVTGSTEPVTLGNSYPISATVPTGYKFHQWTADPSENATFTDDESATTDVTVLNGSVTVTASATEIMSALTTSYTYDEGTLSIDAPTASVSEIGIATTATITAATDIDYTLASWTLENCVRTDGGADNATTITVKSTNGDGAAATVTANYNIIPKITLYFVNSTQWEVVACHHWKEGVSGTTWPGDLMEKVSTVLGFDIYKVKFTELEHNLCIFNNNDNGKQTGNLAVQDGKYYYPETDEWYATVAELPTPCTDCSDYAIAGSMNDWSARRNRLKVTPNNDIVELTLELTAGDYEFKITGPGGWFGNSGKYERKHSGNAWTYRIKDDENNDEDNARIYVDMTGEYTFTWKISTKELTITYPELPDFSQQTDIILFCPSTNWKKDDARFAAYFFGATAEKWVDMTDADGDGIYEAANPKTNLSVKICRLKPGQTETKWENVKWRSINYEIPTGVENCWVVNDEAEDDATGIWTVLIGEGDNSTTLSAANSQTVNTLVNRQFKSGKLYTISLPFALEAEQVETIFGAGTTIYEFAQLAKEGEELVLYFSTPSAIAAATPYLIQPTQDVTKGFIVADATISSTPNNISFTVDNTTITMEAILSVEANAKTDGKYWLAADKYLYNNENVLPALRALFNVSTKSGMPPRARVALGENAATGLDNITNGENTVIKTIENGQLIIIRNGEKFNAQGVRL